ncbi:MAG TPA: phosphotransferase [Thermomicrobiales bacterium]|jgi:aminoglycoside phosphotransferase (APT) family kinase protein
MGSTDLDPRAILGVLGVADGVTALTPVSGGRDTAIWRVERDSRSYALRVFRPEQTAVARREAAVMRAGIPGVPIPAVHAEGVWHNRAALLIEWCEGRILLDALRATPRDSWALAHLFGATQAYLHAATPPESLVAEGRSWATWAGGGGAALTERLRAVAAGPSSVLHFDYHPLNLLVEGRRATGLIDWANVHVGDRRADLARTVAILRLTPLGTGAAAIATILFVRLLELGWRRGYRAVAGPIGGMAPFYAWAGATLVNDLSAKIGRPGEALRVADLDPARRWTAHWMARAGLPAA